MKLYITELVEVETKKAEQKIRSCSPSKVRNSLFGKSNHLELFTMDIVS